MILETMPDVQRLPTDKKLRLIEELWDDLGVSVSEDEFPVEQDHLDKATAALNTGRSGQPWSILRARLKAGLQ